MVMAALAALLAAGCGKGTAPTISELTLSSATIAPGSQLSGQLKASDPDGLAGLKLALRLSGPSVAQPEQTIEVGNATDAIREALVPFVLMIAAQAPAGSYTLTAAVIDGDGERSNELSATFAAK